MCSWTFFVRFTLPCNTAIKQLTDPSSDRRGDPRKSGSMGWLKLPRRLSPRVERAASTIHLFSSSVNCKNVFPLNANATKRQSQKLSWKRDQNPENGIKGEDIWGEHDERA